MLKQDVLSFSDCFTTFRDLCPILTCGTKDAANSMMVNWGGLGYLWGKMVCFVFVRKDRYTFNFSEKSPMFSLSFVNLTPEIINVFGKQSGKSVDKFALTGLHKCLDIDNNLYSIAEAKKVLKLRKLCEFDLAKAHYFTDIPTAIYKDKEYHVLYICEITQYLIGEEDEK